MVPYLMVLYIIIIVSSYGEFGAVTLAERLISSE
jgi:hypothetical protein